MAIAAVLPALLEPSRLRIAGLLCDRRWTATQLANEVGLSERAVLEALAVLQQAKIAQSDDDGTWTVPSTALRSLASAASETELPMDPYIGYGMLDEERLVLSRYFEGRVLVDIPSSRAKRRIVLERLALEFDIGRRYTEDAVNELLHTFHEDHVTIRRYLVDEGFFDRDAGEYWRSGGRVTPEPAS